MATSDFAEIQELQQFRKLYEEQEEKTKMRIGEKDEEIAHLQGIVADRDQQLREFEARAQEMRQEVERIRNDYARLRDEAQQKIDKLMDRVRELNQRLAAGGGGAAAPEKKSGLFR